MKEQICSSRYSFSFRVLGFAGRNRTLPVPEHFPHIEAFAVPVLLWIWWCPAGLADATCTGEHVLLARLQSTQGHHHDRIHHGTGMAESSLARWVQRRALLRAGYSGLIDASVTGGDPPRVACRLSGRWGACSWPGTPPRWSPPAPCTRAPCSFGTAGGCIKLASLASDCMVTQGLQPCSDGLCSRASGQVSTKSACAF